MKTLITIFALLITTNAMAQQKSWYRNPEGNITIDLVQLIKADGAKSSSSSNCHFNLTEIDVQIELIGCVITTDFAASFLNLKSSHDISNFQSHSEHIGVYGNSISLKLSNSKRVIDIASDTSIRQLQSSYSVQIPLYSITVITSSNSKISLLKQAQITSGSLVGLYQNSLASLKELKEWVIESDVEKYKSYIETLERALNSIIDETGKARLPITHWLMAENARLVLGLSELIQEGLKRYESSPKMKAQLDPHTQVLKNMGKEIREAYGWNNGLVGGGSKAVSTLGMIIRTVLVDLEQNADAKQVTDTLTLTKLRQQTDLLVISGEANEGGDAYVTRTRAFEEFVSNWNSANVQGSIARLLASNADKGSVSSKTNLLVMSVNSIRALTGASIEIPQQTQVAPPVAAPVVPVGKKK